MSEQHKGWIGVDLDGCLAMEERWQGLGHIGDPIPEMVQRVKRWLAEGRDVRILSARANPDDAGDQLVLSLATIHEWCLVHIGTLLPVTHAKDRYMLELWDDRAVQVVPNLGMPVSGSLSRIGSI